MDSHHDQVKRAMQAADATAVRRYFAYSTILDREAFEQWKGEHGYESFELPAGRLAEALDVQLVYDFPSRWWGGRVAGLADKPGGSVFGRLFDIAGDHWPIVQHKEGAVTGMCIERPVKVRVEGEVLDAIAFATNPARRSEEGPISERFLQALIRGAESAQLPAAYLEQLRSGRAGS